MSSLRPMTKTAFVVGGLVLLTAAVLMSLPFVGALAFAARGVAILAVPVFILAVLLSPRFRAWLNETPASERSSAKGLVVPERTMFHQKHAWARLEGVNRVAIGADELMERTLGPVGEVALPAVGTEARQGEPLFDVASHGRRIPVRSPLSGVVVRTNAELTTTPRLINTSPYDLGWAVQLQPNALARERRTLLRYEPAGEWLQAEVDRLVQLASGQPAHAVALQDGGALVDELHRELDDETFERIKAELF
jgi:glycine cleavage system H protein